MPESIPRLSAALEGRYRIERELGEGGMATVYLAHDLKHERQVALKVLKPELAAIVGAERFLAEIKTTANLQHPHILPLHDSGDADGFLYYVMPYVEGESLRQRLDRERQLPVEEAVRIAARVAEALDYAHGRGVVHRDIKPANILLSERGEPVVADFGIALAVDAAGRGRLTETGTSLGTPHYMSPEQATGDLSVGAATDIYALGGVLYEMLVGEPPYTGSTARAVLGKIIAGTAEPVTKLRPSVPENVDATIRKALERVPADRFTRAQGFAKALGDPAFRYGQVEGAAGAVAAGGAWSRLSIVLAITTLLFALGLVWALAAMPGSPPDVAAERVSLVLPDDRPVAFGCSPCSSLAISPDGRDVVYVGRGRRSGSETEPSGLLVRSLRSRTVRELPGTEGAGQPFFSPDGRWVAFFTADALKKVPLAGGNALTLVDDMNGGVWGFGTWTDSDEIVFTTSGREDAQRVSADGGPVESLTAVSRGTVVRTPHFLPGTRTVLFTTVGEGSSEPRIEALDLDSGDGRIVIDRGSQPLYLESGYLLWVRDGNMVAAPFDADRLLPTGRVVPLGDGIRTDGPNPGTEGVLLQIAASRTGTLAYVPPPEEGARLGIVSRDGRFEAFGPEIHNPRVALPRVSPDGRTIAFADGTSSDSQIYLHDLVRGSTDPLTQTGANVAPTWHPSGRSLALWSDRGPEPGIYQRELTGAERLLLPAFARGGSWSPDGSVFVYALQDGSNYDVWVVSPDDPSSARPLIEGPAAEYSPRFSPDGRWLAYVSDESGRAEVYVRRYPEGERLRVSTEGGLAALWSPEGGELFFQAGTFEGVGDFMAVSVVQEGETLRLGTPMPLFDQRSRSEDGNYQEYAISTGAGLRFDIFPDGSRFVMVRTAESSASEIVLARNIAQELK